MTDTKQFSILAVDDVPRNLQVMGNLLNSEKTKIYFSTNGRDALHVLKNQSIDLILLDISMPEMDGYEVIKQIKENERTKDIPVLFVTAHNQNEDIVKGFMHGAVDYITKPYNREELRQRVRTHLELKHARDIIVEQNKQLQELNATKNKFFSLIAHDVKNPFSSILGFSSLLKDRGHTYTPEKINHFASTIHNAAERGHKLLESLLDWARLQMNQIEINPQKLSITSLLATSVDNLLADAKEKQIKLSYTTDLQLFAYADIHMANAIVRNLAQNALKFTPKGGQITLSASQEGEYVKINIVDTGIGIPDDIQEKLFRLDSKYTTEGTNGEKGTGLGLLLSNEFALKNHGKITLQSKIGKGSTFSLYLPEQQEKN